MASDNEASCVNDPNFAVICGFLEKFGASCGITSPDFLDLQEMLENTQEVSQELIDLHIKLLRKVKRSVASDRWERVLIKLCHGYCSQDAWELERFGYKKARLSSKLRILKQLLEMQFDFNVKFKAEVNRLTAPELRAEPIGRDKHGHSYWYQIDEYCQMRVYREDPDEETWALVAKDRDGLVRLINQLSCDDPSLANLPLEEDSNSLETEKPVTDTGQSSSVEDLSVNDDSKESGVIQKDDSSSNDPQLSSQEQNKNVVEPLKITIKTHKPEIIEPPEMPKHEEVGMDLSLPPSGFQGVDLSKKKKIPPTMNDMVQSAEIDLSVKKSAKMDPHQFSSLSVPPFEPISIESALKMNSDEEDVEDEEDLEDEEELEEEEEEELDDESDEIDLPDHIIKRPRLDRPTLLAARKKKEESEDDEEEDDEEEYGEEIEEPVMLIRGEGSGRENETEPEFGDVIEEPIMFFYGEGVGVECKTGNARKEDETNPDSTTEEEETTTGNNSEVNCESTLSDKSETSASAKSSSKIGKVIIDVKSNERSSSSDQSPKKLSRWDIGKPGDDENSSTKISIKDDDDAKTTELLNEETPKGSVKELVNRWESVPDSPKTPKPSTFFFGPFKSPSLISFPSDIRTRRNFDVKETIVRETVEKKDNPKQFDRIVDQSTDSKIVPTLNKAETASTNETVSSTETDLKSKSTDKESLTTAATEIEVTSSKKSDTEEHSSEILLDETSKKIDESSHQHQSSDVSDETAKETNKASVDQDLSSEIPDNTSEKIDESSKKIDESLKKIDESSHEDQSSEVSDETVKETIKESLEQDLSSEIPDETSKKIDDLSSKIELNPEDPVTTEDSTKKSSDVQEETETSINEDSNPISSEESPSLSKTKIQDVSSSIPEVKENKPEDLYLPEKTSESINMSVDDINTVDNNEQINSTDDNTNSTIDDTNSTIDDTNTFDINPPEQKKEHISNESSTLESLTVSNVETSSAEINPLEDKDSISTTDEKLELLVNEKNTNTSEQDEELSTNSQLNKSYDESSDKILAELDELIGESDDDKTDDQHKNCIEQQDTVSEIAERVEKNSEKPGDATKVDETDKVIDENPEEIEENETNLDELKNDEIRDQSKTDESHTVIDENEINPEDVQEKIKIDDEITDESKCNELQEVIDDAPNSVEDQKDANDTEFSSETIDETSTKMVEKQENDSNNETKLAILDEILVINDDLDNTEPESIVERKPDGNDESVHILNEPEHTDEKLDIIDDDDAKFESDEISINIEDQEITNEEKDESISKSGDSLNLDENNSNGINEEINEDQSTKDEISASVEEPEIPENVMNQTDNITDEEKSKTVEEDEPLTDKNKAKIEEAIIDASTKKQTDVIHEDESKNYAKDEPVTDKSDSKIEETMIDENTKKETVVTHENEFKLDEEDELEIDKNETKIEETIIDASMKKQTDLILEDVSKNDDDDESPLSVDKGDSTIEETIIDESTKNQTDIVDEDKSDEEDEQLTDENKLKIEEPETNDDKTEEQTALVDKEKSIIDDSKKEDEISNLESEQGDTKLDDQLVIHDEAKEVNIPTEHEETKDETEPIHLQNQQDAANLDNEQIIDGDTSEQKQNQEKIEQEQKIHSSIEDIEDQDSSSNDLKISIEVDEKSDETYTKIEQDLKTEDELKIEDEKNEDQMKIEDSQKNLSASEVMINTDETDDIGSEKIKNILEPQSDCKEINKIGPENLIDSSKSIIPETSKQKSSVQEFVAIEDYRCIECFQHSESPKSIDDVTMDPVKEEIDIKKSNTPQEIPIDIDDDSVCSDSSSEILEDIKITEPPETLPVESYLVGSIMPVTTNNILDGSEMNLSFDTAADVNKISQDTEISIKLTDSSENIVASSEMNETCNILKPQQMPESVPELKVELMEQNTPGQIPEVTDTLSSSNTFEEKLKLSVEDSTEVTETNQEITEKQVEPEKTPVIEEDSSENTDTPEEVSIAVSESKVIPDTTNIEQPVENLKIVLEENEPVINSDDTTNTSNDNPQETKIPEELSEIDELLISEPSPNISDDTNRSTETTEEVCEKEVSNVEEKDGKVDGSEEASIDSSQLVISEDQTSEEPEFVSCDSNTSTLVSSKQISFETSDELLEVKESSDVSEQPSEDDKPTDDASLKITPIKSVAAEIQDESHKSPPVLAAVVDNAIDGEKLEDVDNTPENKSGLIHSPEMSNISNCISEKSAKSIEEITKESDSSLHLNDDQSLVITETPEKTKIVEFSKSFDSSTENSRNAESNSETSEKERETDSSPGSFEVIEKIASNNKNLEDTAEILEIKPIEVGNSEENSENSPLDYSSSKIDRTVLPQDEQIDLTVKSCSDSTANTSEICAAINLIKSPEIQVSLIHPKIIVDETAETGVEIKSVPEILVDCKKIQDEISDKSSAVEIETLKTNDLEKDELKTSRLSDGIESTVIPENIETKDNIEDVIPVDSENNIKTITSSENSISPKEIIEPENLTMKSSDISENTSIKNAVTTSETISKSIDLIYDQKENVVSSSVKGVENLSVNSESKENVPENQFENQIIDTESINKKHPTGVRTKITPENSKIINLPAKITDESDLINEINKEILEEENIYIQKSIVVNKVTEAIPCDRVEDEFSSDDGGMDTCIPDYNNDESDDEEIIPMTNEPKKSCDLNIKDDIFGRLTSEIDVSISTKGKTDEKDDTDEQENEIIVPVEKIKEVDEPPAIDLLENLKSKGISIVSMKKLINDDKDEVEKETVKPILMCVDIAKLQGKSAELAATTITKTVPKQLTPTSKPKPLTKKLEAAKKLEATKEIPKQKSKPEVIASIEIDTDDDVDAVPEVDPLAGVVPPVEVVPAPEKSLSLATFKLDDTEPTDTSLLPEPIARALRNRKIALKPIIPKTKPKSSATQAKTVTPAKVTSAENRKRGLADDDNEPELPSDNKRRKIKGKRVVDVNLRRSVELKHNQDASSSEDDADNKDDIEDQIEASKIEKNSPAARGKNTARRGRNSGGTGLGRTASNDSPAVSNDSQSETSRTDATNTPPIRKKSSPPKRKKRLLGLYPEDLKGTAFPKIDDESPETGRGLRQSRRIAQLKIKEDAERRKIEEFTMSEFKREHKKKKSKKDEDKTFKGDSKKKKSKSSSEEEEADTEDEVIERKKHKKKKKHHDFTKLFNSANPWVSSSGSSTSQEEEEEVEEEPSDEEAVLKSDHEFSPESDLETTEAQPLRRARTVKKESDTEDPTDEHACQKCSKADHPEWILLCDKCDCGWHCSCLRPALLVIPEGDWFCPPCQHTSLIESLKTQLIEYDKRMNRREMEVRRKERLAYVGISLDNVLPAKDNEDRKEAVPPPREGEESSSSGSSDESSSGSSSGEESEPIYQLRERRQAHSYRFNDYDDLINSAIQDELEVKGAGNQGRGKDIATIVNAEKEEQAALLEQQQHQQLEPPQLEQQLQIEASDPSPQIEPENHPVPEQLPVKEPDLDSEEDLSVVPKHGGSKKKHRKLNSLDISSEDDPVDDDDFKVTSASEEEDLDDLGSEDSDDYEVSRRGKRGGPIRRSSRARTTRYDRDFINDDESEDEQQPKRKKTRQDWDESESEDSDKSWGRRKKYKRSRNQSSLPAVPSSKSRKSRKKKKRTDDSDPEAIKPRKIKKPKIVFGGLNDSDDEELQTRRTRGKKINYVDTLGSDSEDENKSTVKPLIESEDEYVANEEEEDEDDIIPAVIDEREDSNSDFDKTPVVPKKIIKLKSNARGRGRGKGGLHRPRKLISPGFDVEPSKLVIPITNPEIMPNIPVIAANPDGLNEEEVGTMMENEEFATKQLELMAIQLANEKKKKEMEARKLEGMPEKKEPKKRGRKKKVDLEALAAAEQQRLAAQDPSLNLALTHTISPSLSKSDSLSSTDISPNIPSVISDLTPSPPKRRGRGKGKKTLAAEAAAAAAAAAALGTPVTTAATSVITTVPAPVTVTATVASNLPGVVTSSDHIPTVITSQPTSDQQQPPIGKLGIAAPPQPFSQNQPAPSVITRMLQSQPVSALPPAQTFTTAANSMTQKYFGMDPGPRGLPPGAGMDLRGGPPMQPGQFPPMVGTRGRVPSPYRQSPPAMNLYPGVRQVGPGSPHRLRSPGPQLPPQLFHSTHHSMDPSPSGGGLTNRDRNSPLAPPTPPMVTKEGGPTPPPYRSRFSPSESSPGPSIRHHIPPQFPQPPRGVPPPGNFSPYHPPPPPNYHYGAYPPQPALSAADDALPPTDYQASAYPEYTADDPGIQSSEGSNSKPFDEEGSGEFGGLVSYFSSQREDDLDT